MSESKEYESQAVKPLGSGFKAEAAEDTSQELDHFPPALEAEDATGYFLRFGGLGAVFGVLGAVSAYQFGVAVSIMVGLLWVLGILCLSIIAPLRAKQHRGGIGYPADAKAWVKSYRMVLDLGTVVIGIVALLSAWGLNLALMPTESEEAFNFLPLILLLIMPVLAFSVMRYLNKNKLLWLVYGQR